MGFGGKLEAESDLGKLSPELDTSYGVNVRSDLPVLRYLVLGPLFQVGAYRLDREPKPNRDYYADVDLFVRGRLPIEFDRLALQLWAGVPIGLTLSFLGSTSAGAAGTSNELSGFGVGWNFGILAGGAVHFSKVFGMFVEMGWQSHRMSHDFANRSGDVSLKVSQTIINLGFMFHSK
jgi:hypothetical protein